MPLYLSPILGDGTALNPFTPVWTGEDGQGWIDLRPDCTIAAGVGILWLPSASLDVRLIKLADFADDILPAVILTRLQNALSVTLSQTRFREIVAELLTLHARTDGTRWRPLQETIENVMELWLGSLGRFYAWVPGSVGASFSETWPTNGTNIATGQDQPWNEDLNDAQVSANKLTVVSIAANVYGRCTSAVATGNHTVQADSSITVDDGTTRVTIVTCRKINSTVETYYGVARAVTTSVGNASRDLRKLVAGAFTQLAIDTTDTGTGSLAITVTANGSSISGTVGTFALGPVTDTGITGNLLGGYALRINVGGAAGEANLDNWSIGDLGAGTFPLYIGR